MSTTDIENIKKYIKISKMKMKTSEIFLKKE